MLSIVGGLFLHFLIFAQIHIGQSVIPKACVENITAIGGSGICCPIPKGSRLICGGYRMGTCHRQFIQLEPVPKHNLQDDRMLWPSRFFTHTCRCEGNRFGLACEQCWFGWEGPNCDVRQKLVRRDVLKFTPTERRMFRDIVDKTAFMPTDYVIPYEADRMHSDPMWKPKFLDVSFQYLLAFTHDYASRGTLYKNEENCKRFKKLDNNHHVIGFATWHRYFMLIWERELRKTASKLYGWDKFAIPYWDWVDSKKCDVCVNSLVGAEGKLVNGIRLLHPESPFSNWTEYCSMPKSGSGCASCHVLSKFKPLNRAYVDTKFPTTENLLYTLNLKHGICLCLLNKKYRKMIFASVLTTRYYLPEKSQDVDSCRGFHNALEGFCGDGKTDRMYMHNIVHNMVYGSFCCAPTAANDPLFILHHSQIDRIMQVWFERNHPRITEFPNHDTELANCRECNMIGFIPTVRHAQMFSSMREFGIYYDNLKFGKHGFDGKKFIELGSSYFDEIH